MMISGKISDTLYVIRAFAILSVITAHMPFGDGFPVADIGRKSYLIYLIQMQPAGMINTRLPYNVPFFVLRPFIALALIYIAVKLFEFVLEKTSLKKHAELFALR